MKNIDNEKKIRLQVYLSHSGVASRRACEVLISNGRVSVNGKVVRELGVKVDERDLVCVDGSKIKLETQKRYVLLHKPAGYVCSSSDEKGRLKACSLLKNVYKERLYNVGRLDMMSSGAILFTNDGEFCARLEHPSSKIEKEYRVETLFPFSNDVLDAFMKGIRIEGIFYKAFKVARLEKRKMKIILIEGKNREIRRVLQHFQIKIKKLVRVRIGSVYLQDLKEGESRDLKIDEIEKLKSLIKVSNKEY